MRRAQECCALDTVLRVQIFLQKVLHQPMTEGQRLIDRIQVQIVDLQEAL